MLTADARLPGINIFSTTPGAESLDSAPWPGIGIGDTCGYWDSQLFLNSPEGSEAPERESFSPDYDRIHAAQLGQMWLSIEADKSIQSISTN
jgi:hypothetical protein